MKKFVFTVKEDVCTANGKDVNATQLLDVMRTYGTVENYDAHVKSIKDEYQTEIDRLVAQNEAIKEQNLSVDEIEIVNAYRRLKAQAMQVHIDEKNLLKKQLEDIKTEEEKRIVEIAKLLGIAPNIIK